MSVVIPKKESQEILKCKVSLSLVEKKKISNIKTNHTNIERTQSCEEIPSSRAVQIVRVEGKRPEIGAAPSLEALNLI